MKLQNAEIHITVKDGRIDARCNGDSHTLLSILETVLAQVVYASKKAGVPLKVLANDERKHVLMYLQEIEKRRCQE